MLRKLHPKSGNKIVNRTSKGKGAQSQRTLNFCNNPSQPGQRINSERNQPIIQIDLVVLLQAGAEINSPATYVVPS